MNKIDEIKERRSKVSHNGDWYSMHGEDLIGANQPYELHGMTVHDGDDSLGWVKGGLDAVDQNMEFVINAPKDIDYLLKENESLREELSITKENWRSMANQLAIANGAKVYDLGT